MPRKPLYPHVPARKVNQAEIQALVDTQKSGCPACAKYIERIRFIQQEKERDTSGAIEGTLRHWRYHMSRGDAHPRGFSILDKLWTL